MDAGGAKVRNCPKNSHLSGSKPIAQSEVQFQPPLLGVPLPRCFAHLSSPLLCLLVFFQKKKQKSFVYFLKSEAVPQAAGIPCAPGTACAR